MFRSVIRAVGRLPFPFGGGDRPEIGFVPSKWRLAGCGSHLEPGIDLKLGSFRQNGQTPDLSRDLLHRDLRLGMIFSGRLEKQSAKEDPMTAGGTRLLLVLSLALCAWTASAQAEGPRFEISFPASAHAGPITGRVFVIVARDDNEYPPRNRSRMRGSRK